jgi:sulfite reductase alpha subunit-like flavoprotein
MMNGHGEDREHTVEDRRLTILYATVTGNAQDLAESVARHAIRQHFTTQCLSMDEYNAV